MDKHNIWLRMLDNGRRTEDGHLLWKGGCDQIGYGIIQIEGKNLRVHRLSAWIHLNLDINNPKERALHKDNICRKKHCFNFDHLYVGSQADNLNDQLKSKTHRSYRFKNKTHCIRGHLLPKNRVCKECNRIRAKKFYENHK